jgi:predicted GH43/DUF377 family glycosyl hydrolase
MKDLAERFKENPLLIPKNLMSSQPEQQIISLLNPGVFFFDEKTWLLVRVAESLPQKDNVVFVPVEDSEGQTTFIEVSHAHPELLFNDARKFTYQGLDYLTTKSHLQLLASTDGIHFEPQKGYLPLMGSGKLENFGIEDCRVSLLEHTYYLTYTAVSSSGVGVGLRTTRDWKNFEHKGMILPPHNKDCAIFEEKVNGLMYCFHRPSSIDLGGNFIWLASSPDGIHWGNHQCLIKTRPALWDNARVGAGAAPIKTSEGWLSIYHGANEQHQYCLGAFLLDLENPSKVLSRTIEPIMVPTENYEISGFFGFVVFTNGHIVNGDQLTIYYGAADEFVCGATFSITAIISSLKPLQT